MCSVWRQERRAHPSSGRSWRHYCSGRASGSRVQLAEAVGAWRTGHRRSLDGTRVRLGRRRTLGISLIKKSIRFQNSEPSRGVDLARRAHMISRVRIRGRAIECFGRNSDDRAACVAQAIVADRTDQQSAEPDMLPSSDDK